VRKHVDLAILNRLARIAGCAIIFSFGATATSSADDIESVKAGLAAKQCPAAEIAIINGNDRCNPNGRESKACDQRFPAASAAWQNCYYGIEQCRKQVSEDNDVIYKSNEAFRQCHRSDAASSKTLPMGGKGVPASDLAGRLAAQQAKNATADDVRRQQDQQFNDTVRAHQQQYQQRNAAREQAERARQKQAPSTEGETVVNQERCSLVGRYAWNAEEYARGCPCQPGTYFDGQYCIDNKNRGR
jgi:hypothetical protein